MPPSSPSCVLLIAPAVSNLSRYRGGRGREGEEVGREREGEWEEGARVGANNAVRFSIMK